MTPSLREGPAIKKIGTGFEHGDGFSETSQAHLEYTKRSGQTPGIRCAGGARAVASTGFKKLKGSILK
jgi:hypothetical protein